MQPVAPIPVQPPRSARKALIQRVPARRAFSWLGAGWQVFAAQPIPWVLMSLIVFVCMTIVSTLIVPLPIVGPMAAPVLFVLLTGGMLSAAARQERSEEVRPIHLFDGFSSHGGSLALVGIFYSVPLVLMSLITMIAAGGLLLGVALGGLMHWAVTIISAVMTGWVVTLAVLSLIVLSLICAPALIMYRGIAPLEAMSLSLKASLRNIGAMMVFGLLMYCLFVLALVPAGLGILVFIPVSVGALQQAHKDMFSDLERRI